jgi:hypothetical protein
MVSEVSDCGHLIVLPLSLCHGRGSVHLMMARKQRERERERERVWGVRVPSSL